MSLEYKQDKISFPSSDYSIYKDWWDEEKIEERKSSVEKYGGFYVGRYEAGVEESKGYEANDAYTGNHTNRNKSADVDLPVTKKERQAWNYVNQPNAKALSEKMYANSNSVTSRLIDSYAWDTICTWLSNNGIDVIKDSTSWGNYYNATYKINGLCAMHTWNREKSQWIAATNYRIGKMEIPKEKSSYRYEVATGVTAVDDEGNEVDRNKAKNIYDFAGNMWEWTTEIGNHSTTEPQSTPKDDSNDAGSETYTGNFAVIRGGPFDYEGSRSPASFRNGQWGVNGANPTGSFRPVLYIK